MWALDCTRLAVFECPFLKTSTTALGLRSTTKLSKYAGSHTQSLVTNQQLHHLTISQTFESPNCALNLLAYL